MDNIVELPISTVGEVLRTIVQYSLTFAPYMEELAGLERTAGEEKLNWLASSRNPEVNRAAVYYANHHELPSGCQEETSCGLLLRLLHNKERLEKHPAEKKIILAYMDEEKELRACPDILEFVLLRAKIDAPFAFLFPS